jgi:hypothetical protein
MISFWNSPDKLDREGLKIAWFGVAVVFLSLTVPNIKWLSFVGLTATVAGLILKQRATYLKKVDSSPRILSEEIEIRLSDLLKDVPKQPLTIVYFGQDLEAKQHATQIKRIFETAKFQVKNFSGCMVFEMHFGLKMTVFKKGASDSTAVAIQNAFSTVGLDVSLELNPNQMEPEIQFSVLSKPKRTD